MSNVRRHASSGNHKPDDERVIDGSNGAAGVPFPRLHPYICDEPRPYRRDFVDF